MTDVFGWFIGILFFSPLIILYLIFVTKTCLKLWDIVVE